MIDKASPAGWVIQVTIPAPTAPSSQDGERWKGPQMVGAPSFEYCNVAIESPDKAVEATRKYLGKSKADACTVRRLASAEVAALGLKDGEVKPA